VGGGIFVSANCFTTEEVERPNCSSSAIFSRPREEEPRPPTLKRLRSLCPKSAGTSSGRVT